MTDEELIARLQDWPYQGETMAGEAADRIEALTKERDEAMQLLKTLSNMNGDLSRDLYKAKLLLAKAVAFLEEIAVTGDWFISDMNDLIKELKGESHE